MRNKTKTLRTQSIILLILFALLATASTQMGQAKISRQKMAEQTPEQRITVMERFREDIRPSKRVAPQAATPCVEGMADVYPCSNVDLLAFVPFDDMSGGNQQANDIWGWTDEASGREFALLGRTNGTEFVEITDPENPVYLGSLPTHTSSSPWRDVKTHGNHAIIGSEAAGHGMQIFDLMQLLTVTSPTTFSASAHFPGFGNSHNVVSNEESDFVYGVGTDTCTGGLHMVDLSDPLNPADAGCFDADGYTHDAQCVIYAGPDSDYTGKEICLNSNEDTLTIVDVTDKNSPTMLSRVIGFTGCVATVNCYTHQGWLTEDSAYFLINDEIDETASGQNTTTYIWDVRDLDAPQMIGTYVASTPAIDHNLYIVGDRVYQANYRAGLRILDAADVANGNLTEVGYFDVYPANNSANFNGAWSVYPYFDSGTVIVSSIETGLFIVQPNFVPDFTLAADNISLQQCIGEQSSTMLSLGALNGFADSVSLMVDGVPDGVIVNFSSAMTMPSAPATQLTLNITNTNGAPGSYPLSITADGGGIERTVPLELQLIGDTAVAPALTAPSNNGAGGIVPQFRWEAVFGATSYMFELATDAAFTNIIAVETTSDLSFTPAFNLDPNTPYYWRVTVENLCGAATVSESFTFTTANQSQVCSEPNLAIPDNAPLAGASDTLTVDSSALSGEIVDLDVSLTIPHSFVGDLGAELVHINSGITVRLFSQVGLNGAFSCDGDLIDIVLDDANSNNITEVCAEEIVGSFQAEQSLSAFTGQEIEGSWQLFVTDFAGPDTGIIESWCLLPTLEVQGGGDPISPPTAIEMQNVTGEWDVLPVVLLGLIGCLIVVMAVVGRKRTHKQP